MRALQERQLLLARPGAGCRARCAKWRATFKEFASAFKDPCFRNYWLLGLFGSVTGMD